MEASGPRGAKLTIRCLGPARDWVGKSEFELELDKVSNIAQVRRHLLSSFPQLKPYGERVAFCINGEVATNESQVADGDEIALLPPVAGGCEDRAAYITREPLQIEECLSASLSPSVGGIATFFGVVRGEGGRVTALEYEVFEPLAERQLATIAQELKKTYELQTMHIVHRVGRVKSGEIAVAIFASAPHRKAALEAVQVAIERLKREVPIWKKELGKGGGQWVEGEPLGWESNRPLTS